MLLPLVKASSPASLPQPPAANTLQDVHSAVYPAVKESKLGDGSSIKDSSQLTLALWVLQYGQPLLSVPLLATLELMGAAHC